MNVVHIFLLHVMFLFVSSRYLSDHDRKLSDHCPSSCSCDFLEMSFECIRKNLTSIPEEIDLNATSLTLSFNRFNGIPSSISNMKNLQYLDLSNNPDIRIIEINYKSVSLKTLQLRSCSIDYVDNTLFKGFPNLEILNLSGNRVNSLNTSLVSVSLKTLDLSRCDLKHIRPQALKKFTSLSYLSVSSNPNLRQFHCESESLLTLDISNCNLEHVPSGPLKKVVELDLHGNNIQSLRNRSFVNLTNTEVLNISYNAVREINMNSFSRLTRLSVLDLSYNRLNVIERNTFKENERLKSLYMSHNYIRRIKSISSSSLQVLDLSSCEISSLSQYSLRGLPQLTELHLMRNQIWYIPNNLEGPRLVYLDLGFNDISSINNKTFASLRFLRFLVLSGNKLTAVQPNFFPQVIDLSIEDNPWLCDCDTIHEMYSWMIKTDQNTMNLRCQLPAKVEGLTWREACDSTWSKVVADKKTVWMYSMPFVITFAILLLLIYISKLLDRRKKTQEEGEEAERREAAERLELIQRQQTRERLRRLEEQEEFRNAPDPRESTGPPSYNEALTLPRLDASHPSLAGSLPSLSSLHSSNPDVSKRRRARRKKIRKRKLSVSQQEPASASNHSDGSDQERTLSPTELEESSF